MRSMFLSLLFVTTFVAASFADRRNYVWTYQYITLPKGMTELEFYQTTKLAQLDSWEYRIEVEHGITDHLDFSVYQIFQQKEDEAFKWDAVQFRSRYRFGESDQYVVDPLLYLEYNRKLDLEEPNKIETKLILANQFQAINVALNPVYEIFFAPGLKQEVGLDFGLSYEFTPQFIIGVESTSRMEFENDEKEMGSYFGPTVSFASGNWWYTAGAAWGMTSESDDLRVRFLMGISL